MRTLALVSAVLLGSAPQAPPPAKELVPFEDKNLAIIDDDVTPKDITFSKDGKNVAYRGIRSNGRQFVAVNKQKGPEYQSIQEGLSWGTGAKIAYRASNGGTWQAVVGGAPVGSQYAFVGRPIFSPDGSKFAFEASRGTGGAQDKTAWSMLVGGAKGADFGACGPPHWSGDSSLVAHTVRIGKPGTAQRAFFSVQAVVVGGKVGPEAEEVGEPVMSPKGRGVAYRSRNGETWTLLVDGKSVMQAAEIGDPKWSPDGKSVTYKASKDGSKWMACVDGKTLGTHQLVGDPVWAPDGKKVAYTAQDGAEATIVVGDQKTPPFVGVGDPTFSPDGTTVAFPARATGKWMVVVGDKRGQADYDVLTTPVFSPDSKRVAYFAMWKFKWIIVIDDGKSEMFDQVGKIAWSPKSDKAAWSAAKDGKWYMVVHYRRQEAFDEILTPPYWNSSGTKVAFGARKGPDISWRVINVPE